MYSRDFGGIKSDGQLYNYEREYNESRTRHEVQNDCEYGGIRENEHGEVGRCEKGKGLRLDFLRDMKIDDLILIGIGLLLLLDADGDNDIFVLLIALLLFF
ncbi:MAG: hypothetical protein IJC20_00590 [Clostridia bacterium]|nr:hypothetical protein [Clostridia bacterium]